MKAHIICILLLLMAFSSCRTKKVTTEKTKIVIDTIYRDKQQLIQLPSTSTILINDVCDSLGILRRFKQTFKSDKVNVTIESKNNELTAYINIDSIKQSAIKEYISKNKSETEYVEIIKYRIPKWVWWLVATQLLSFIWIFGNKWIKNTFPILKFIPF